MTRGWSFWRVQTEGVRAWINIGLLGAFIVFILLSLNARQLEWQFGGELFLNLAAETMGVWLAVVLIGEVMRRDQEKREKPARVAALDRIRVVHHEISRFWMSLVLQAVTVNEHRRVILDLDDLKLFDERLAKAINLLDFNTKTHTRVPEPMSRFVMDQALNIRKRFDTVSLRYANYITPEMAAALDRVEMSPFIQNLSQDVERRMAQTEDFFAQPHVDMGDLSSSRLDIIIGTHWYEDFIPAINELGRVIADAIQLLGDAAVRQSESDGQLRMSVGSEPPPAQQFDPDCKEIVKELRISLSQEPHNPEHWVEVI